MSAKRKVAVVADSSISLPAEMVERYRVLVVPIAVIFGDRVYQDGVDIEPPTFYALLRQSPKPPTTSGPRPIQFLEAFRQAAQQADSILCLTLAAKLSSTHQSACSAAEMAVEQLPGVPIRVVDTDTAAAAEGLITLEAARAAAEGWELAQVVELAQGLIPRVRLVGFLDTLHYVWKGGRIGRAQAFLGSLLRTKPMVELAGGEVRPLERPRTTQRAVERLLAVMRQYVGEAPAHVAVVHAEAPREAQALRERVAREFQCRELFICEFTPVIGAHTGPGLLGCAFYAEGPDPRST